jgi:hypothetical protein
MNYDHDNLLKIGGYGGERYIPKGDYADTGTALAKPVDVQRIAQDGLNSNVEIVNQVLRQFATTAPADNRHPQQSGIASPAELASRNERFKWTIVAVVVLSAITALGIVLVAQRVVEIDAFETIAGWLVLSGLGGYASATWVHSRESALTPESIEMERVRGDYDIASVDAESRQIIARAFAESIVNDSEVKRAYAEAQRAANRAYLESSKPVQAPQRAQPTSYDDSYQDDYEQPQQAPFAPTMATYELAQELEFQPIAPAQPDRALVAMLQAIGELYADCERRDSDTITTRLPWSARGDWSARDKERAQAVLDTFDPALIIAGEGNRYRLNRQYRKRVAELIIVREWL